MKVWLCFALVLACTSTAWGWNENAIPSSRGRIFIGGAEYNRQVFLKTDSQSTPITKFNRWERVEQIVLSPDEHYLLIAHRPDGAPAYEVSVMDMDSFTIISTVKPGFGGRFMWTKSGNVLLIWGCGTSCRMFKLWDSSLHLLATDGGSLFEFIQENVIVDAPCIRYNGKFRVFSLTTGKVIATQGHDDLKGDYYCSNVWSEDNVIKAKLEYDPQDSTARRTIILTLEFKKPE